MGCAEYLIDFQQDSKCTINVHYSLPERKPCPPRSLQGFLSFAGL